MRKLPEVRDRRTLDYGGRFQIERLDLRFSNGAERTFERMLPRGPLGRRQLGNLRVYAGTEHPHEAQQPQIARCRRP